MPSRHLPDTKHAFDGRYGGTDILMAYLWSDIMSNVLVPNVRHGYQASDMPGLSEGFPKTLNWYQLA